MEFYDENRSTLLLFKLLRWYSTWFNDIAKLQSTLNVRTRAIYFNTKIPDFSDPVTCTVTSLPLKTFVRLSCKLYKTLTQGLLILNSIVFTRHRHNTLQIVSTSYEIFATSFVKDLFSFITIRNHNFSNQ